ncbi:MAG: GreA/GreB family elongation factor [Candidatus Dojkabacteria bacterium]|nr:GreA/GreB family elongation factor [Candidatus Dojkabacteria bacterium]
MKHSRKELTKTGVEQLQLRISALGRRLKEIMDQMNDIGLSEDTSENMEYDQLRWEKLGLQAEIDQLTELLQNADIIKEGSFTSAQPGSRLRLENHRICLMFQLVSSPEANPRIGKISSESPIGSSILGKRVGDCVVVPTPLGKIDFQIKSIG